MSISQAANAAVPNPVAAAMEALKSGQDVEAAVYGGSASTSADAAEPAEDQQPPESEGTEEQSPTTDEPVVAEVEEIEIADADGRKKVKVDWTDREKLKKYVQTAHAAHKGMRKFQTERDQALTRLKEVEPQYQELAASWKAVEEAFQKDGVRGLVNLLAGNEGAYDQHIEQQYSRRSARAEAERMGDRAAIDKLDLEERLAKEASERARLAKQVEEHLQKANQEREQASYKALEARIYPAFERHRFAGKLGDSTAEHQLDSAVWQQAVQRLEQYPEGTELTPELVDKEFRAVAATFQKIVTKQAERKADATLKQKKAAAAETAATVATKGMRQSDSKETFKNSIRSGKIADAFAQFMTGKIKL